MKVLTEILLPSIEFYTSVTHLYTEKPVYNGHSMD